MGRTSYTTGRGASLLITLTKKGCVKCSSNADWGGGTSGFDVVLVQGSLVLAILKGGGSKNFHPFKGGHDRFHPLSVEAQTVLDPRFTHVVSPSQ